MWVDLSLFVLFDFLLRFVYFLCLHVMPELDFNCFNFIDEYFLVLDV